MNYINGFTPGPASIFARSRASTFAFSVKRLLVIAVLVIGAATSMKSIAQGMSTANSPTHTRARLVLAAQGADAVSPAAYQRARSFMDSGKRGSEILGFMHFGATYHGARYMTWGTTGGGSFALKYSFGWETDEPTDHTEAWFYFNGNGAFDHMAVINTTAILNQPFLAADLSITVFGNVLINAYKDQLTSDDRKRLQKMVADEDAKGLLEWQLRLDQFFGN